MAYTPLPNPWKNVPHVGSLIDSIQSYLGGLLAADIPIVDVANDFTATEVEGALAELQSDAEAHTVAADPHAGYVLESLVDAKGDLIAGTAADAVSRLAVGTNGHVLTAASGEATGMKWAAANPEYGTSLPASPTDGQEFILVDSTTAATWQWRLRYNSARSSYKWEFIGGTSLFHERLAGNASNTTYSTVKTYSSLPSGKYLCHIIQDVQGAPETWYASIGFGGSAATDADAAVGGGASGVSMFRMYEKTASAGDMIFAFKKTDGTNENVRGAIWNVTPRYVE